MQRGLGVGNGQEASGLVVIPGHVLNGLVSYNTQAFLFQTHSLLAQKHPPGMTITHKTLPPGSAAWPL